jgi:hypothetical protein
MLWLRRMIGSISMREYEEQEQKSREYGVISQER